MRARDDAFALSVAVLAALAAVGLLSVALAWRGLADSVVAAVQLPYAVSGAVGGVGLLGFALGLLAVQAGRRQRARERDDLDRLAAAASSLLAALRQEPAP